MILRQFFTTDAKTICTAIWNRDCGAGPDVVARLTWGGEVVDIHDYRYKDGQMQVKLTEWDEDWTNAVAVYKMEE